MSRAKDDGVSVSAMDANSGGGLDWLQAAVQSKPAMVSTAEPKGQKAETGASQNANDTGGETVETDWLQAALRGSAPAKVSPAVAKESTPTELSGNDRHAKFSQSQLTRHHILLVKDTLSSITQHGRFMHVLRSPHDNVLGSRSSNHRRA